MLKRIQSVVRAASIFGGGLAFLVISLASSAFARDVKVPDPIFNAAAAEAFPQEVFDKIASKVVTFQTTFEQLTPEGIVRWWTRTIKLVDFVKAPSQTYRDTYLYAMRYAVSVISERDTLTIYRTSCQVVGGLQGRWL